jgi:hypothetical protein
MNAILLEFDFTHMMHQLIAPFGASIAIAGVIVRSKIIFLHA